MTEEERLVDRLCNDPTRRLANFNIFPGERGCTREELCAEINKALDQVDSGASVPSKHPVDSGIEPIDVREWLNLTFGEGAKSAGNQGG